MTTLLDKSYRESIVDVATDVGVEHNGNRPGLVCRVKAQTAEKQRRQKTDRCR
ncbi:MAG TPA: hypothetical protein VIJ53_17330 [Acidobacteriaceae bacterium]